MDYATFSKQARSEKVTMAVMRAKQRLKAFTFVSGTSWSRTVAYHVSNVTGAPYTFNPATMTLTVTSAVNPNTLNIIAEYSFYFSDAPVNEDVEWQPRLQSIGALKLDLDTENTGIAIESDSSVKLENTDGYFDEIFDSLVWENQLCEFYSWSFKLPWSERKLIYKGYISTKSFTEKSVSFNLKDSFVKLREKIPFTGTRLIYGRVKNIDGISLDQVGDGFTLSNPVSGLADRDALSGVLSGTSGASTITGSGTSFTTQLTAGDKLRIIDGLTEYSYTVSTITNNTSLTITGTISATFSGASGKNANKLNNIITSTSGGFLDEVSPDDVLTINGIDYTVDSVTSDTELTIQSQIETAFTDATATNSPSINYRYKNRSWEIAGHYCGSHATSITSVLSSRAFTVADPGHIQAGDIIKLVLVYYTVSRVSGSTIFLTQDVSTTIAPTNTVLKVAVQSVKLGSTTFVPGRDYVESNDLDSCQVVFDDLAEFNAATESIPAVALSFANGSRTVTSLSASVDLTSLFQPRDFIIPNNGSATWYEVLNVTETTLSIRTAFSGSFNGPVKFRRPDYIGDTSELLFDCMGKKDFTSGEWLKTAPQAVKSICELIGMTSFNTQSFTDAATDADYTLSIAWPESIGGSMPVARDAIKKINSSVFGSLYSDPNFDIAYKVLSADRDEAIELVRDDDILSFSTSTKNQIVKTVTVKYRHEMGTDTYSTYSFSNTNIPGIQETLELDVYLYDEGFAQIIAERYAFFRSLPQTTVNIKGKLNFALKTLNDRVYLKLDRLFKRYASSTSIKIGLISHISKDGANTEVHINDLGNIFSRVGAIAPDTMTDFASASEDEIARYAFIVDDNSETVDTASDATLGTNLIG